ncbi:ElyC/SanA/YdcF family protein [Arcobacter sp. CECT 8985]|uniref:ElyC/SanA/YdcF family protein n=1 Tax=Arcobacter sp. CECT 8985 TaxID=1935424 RepID=UPI00215A072A|nr:ElyC/SanA/YdcF family protein [Arcobacter sp. CECT 8985]
MPLPIGLIILLLGLYFLYKKSYFKSKIFICFSLIWIVLLSYEPISNRLLFPLENSYKDLKIIPKDVKYILVLGSSHTTNKSLSITSQLSTTALNRFIEAYRIYKNIPNAKLIFSGYGGKDVTAHAFMQKELALDLKIDNENILTLSTPKDTTEEAVSVKNLIKGEKFIVVTSASHMPRVMKIFKKLRLNAIPAPTNHLAKDKGQIFSRPSGYNLYKSELAFHEYLGTLWEKLKDSID